MCAVYEEGVRNGAWKEGTDKTREEGKGIGPLQDAVGDETREEGKGIGPLHKAVGDESTWTAASTPDSPLP